MKSSPFGCLFGIAIIVSATSPVRATIFINDGTTVSITSSGNATDDYDTDHQPAAGGGVLEIDTSGNLVFSNARTIFNTHGEGVTRILGTLTQSAGSPGTVASDVQLESGGTIRSISSDLLLTGGGEYSDTLDAAGGSIVFNGGKHTLSAAQLAGADYLRAWSGEVSVLGSVGPVSGAATGGFTLEGGTLTRLGALGGSTFGRLSADHGILAAGTIDGASLRYTGTVSKSAGTTLTIPSGSLTSEGTMDQNGGFIDVDPAGSVSFGTISNKGTWNLANLSVVKSTDGDGAFTNSGLLALSSGVSIFTAKTDNVSGGEIRTAVGTTLALSGGGSFTSGSTLNADGAIALEIGAFLLSQTQIVGSGGLQIGSLLGSAATLSVLGPSGPETGPATGGLSLFNGSITGLGGIGGAGSQSVISVDHGSLVSGIIRSVLLRYTGAATISANSLISLDNASITNDGVMTQIAGASVNTDALATPGGGSLVNHGTWNITGSSLIFNTNGDGEFVNEGNLVHDGTNALSSIAAKFINKTGGTMRATNGSSVHLNGGGSYQTGSTLDADGGSIYLGGGSHTFTGCSITGSGYVKVGGFSQVGLIAPVGPLTGPANGGFALSGGQLNDLSALVGGLGNGTLSVDHGLLAAGSINGATLRLTGNSVKENDTTLILNGTLANEGTLDHQTAGIIDVDAQANDRFTGTIENSGTWNISGPAVIRSTHGEGEFTNSGLLLHSAIGESYIGSPVTNRSGGEIRVTHGLLYLQGGGVYRAGGTLNANGGSIHLAGGAHDLFGTTLAGSSDVIASTGGTVAIQTPVGPASGPASGGFSVSGGTVAVGGFGGSLASVLSADHGFLADGVVGQVRLRYTGNVSKLGTSELTMHGTLQNEGSMFQSGGGNFETDANASPGAGSIVNSGTWTMDGGCFVKNTNGQGTFDNSGTLVQNTGSNAIRAAFQNKDGSIIRSLAGQITLEGGGVYESGSTLDADGGVNVAGGFIFLAGGTHEFNGGTLTGTTFTAISAGQANINQNVGAETGPATGGFALYGGTVGGTATLSADHGFFYTSSITDSVVLRYTGQSYKQDGTTTTMFGGTIRNDGTFGQGTGGNFELDGSVDPGAGTILNNGLWTISGANTFSNTHGEGLFRNPGEIHQTDGSVVMRPAFHNEAGGEIHVTGGSLTLAGGSNHQPSSLLDADGGDIHLNGSGHVFEGGALAGSGYLGFPAASSASLQGNVGNASGAASGGVSLTGGQISGDAMISADHGYLYSGTINENTTLRLTGATLKDINSTLTVRGTLANDGVLDEQTGGNFETDDTTNSGGGILANRGTWNLNGAVVISNSSGSGTFANQGALNQKAGGNNIYAAFDNLPGGSLNATGGHVLLRGGGTQSPGSTLNADGGDIYFNGGIHNWSGGQLAGSSFVYASAGTVSLTGDVGTATGPATGGFGITGGTVTGTATLSAARGYFSSGTIDGDVTLRFTTEFVKEDNSQLSLNGGIIINDGTFNQSSGGNFDLDSQSSAGAGKIVNVGEWNLAGSNFYSNSYGSGVIENAGNFNQLGGTNNVYAAFTNLPGGAVNATAGELYLRAGINAMPGSILNSDGGLIYLLGGTQVLDSTTLTGSGFLFAGSGAITISGNSDSPDGNFGISGGTVTGDGTLKVRNGYFSSGTVSGNVTLRFAGTSDKAANTSLGMGGGILWNEGVFNQASGANIDTDSDSGPGAGLLRNSGTWNLNGSSVISNSYQGGVFENSGLLVQNSGTSLIHPAFNNLAGGILRTTTAYTHLFGGGLQAAGSILDAAGGDIYFSSGTHTFAGNSITGPNQVYITGGRINVTADVNAATGPATGGFGVAGGTLGGTATLSVDHGYFSSGTVTDTVVMRLTGTSEKTANTSLGMNSGTLWNQGVFNQAPGASIDTDSDSGSGAALLRNSGTWNLNGTSYIDNSYQNGILENSGTIQQNAGSTLIYAVFNNLPGGILQTNASYTQFFGGGTHSAGSALTADGGDIYFSSGTHTFAGNTITGPNQVYLTGGRINVTADVNATSGSTTGGFGVDGGTLGGNAILSVDHGYFSSGTITDTVVMRLTGTSEKTANTSLGMNGGTLWNQGNLIQEPNGNFDLDSDIGSGGGLLRNSGTWTITGGIFISNSYQQGAIENTGTLEITSGTTNIYAPLSNSGTLRLTAGTLYLLSPAAQNGALVVNGGIALYGGTYPLSGASASVSGNGYLYGDLAISDGATLSPGDRTGTFAIHGNVVFTGGGANPTVRIDLADAGQSDQITLGNGGTLALGSGLTDLAIVLHGTSSYGSTYRILSAESGSGTFTGRFRNAADGSLVSVSHAGRNEWFRITYDSAGKFIDLSAITAYQAWAAQNGLSGEDAAFTADPDGDVISNGIEFVLGSQPNPANPSSQSSALLPTVSLDPAWLRVTHRRNADSARLNPFVEYSSTLNVPWTPALDGTDGVVIETTDNFFGSGIDCIEVKIPRSLSTGGKLFARLRVQE